MAIAKITGAQIDFSAGELDDSVKRAHDSIQKIGARQMANWRVLSSKAIQNRPGRSVIRGATGRVDEINTSGHTFFLNFYGGNLAIIDASGVFVAGFSTFHRVPTDAGFAIPWTTNSVGGIVWAQIKNTIYIAYPDGA